MLLVATLYLLCAYAQAQQLYCTHTPYHWQVVWCGAPNTTIRQSYTLCGADWCALLAVEPEGMLLPENRLWLLGARQFVAAAMNRLRLQWRTPDAVNASLMLLGDSLESHCATLSQWKLSGALSDALETLYAFNHDTATTCPPPPQNGTGTLPVDTFYYTRAPDILVLRGAGANGSAAPVSTLRSTTSTSLTLLVLCVVSVLANLLGGLKLLADRSNSRHFDWCRRKGAIVGGGDEEGDEDDRVMEMLDRNGLSSSSEDDAVIARKES